MATPEGKGDPGRVLRGGRFFSQVARQQRHQHLMLSELWHSGAGKVPYHEHEVAYVTVVLDGNYAEGDRHGRTELPPFTAIFNPSGVTHVSEVGRTGMKLFTIECWPQLLEQLNLRLPNHPVVDSGSGGMFWSGMSVFSAFKTGTADALLLDSHLAEMLGAVAGRGPADNAIPRWFARVRDRLHAQFREPLRVRDLAEEAGVHPVHLARVFRAREGQTPGDYVQRLRVRAACERLRAEDASLAMVAAECGFADQSHFTRTFRKLVGSTPGRFRQALRTAPSPRHT